MQKGGQETHFNQSQRLPLVSVMWTRYVQPDEIFYSRQQRLCSPIKLIMYHFAVLRSWEWMDCLNWWLDHLTVSCFNWLVYWRIEGGGVSSDCLRQEKTRLLGVVCLLSHWLIRDLDTISTIFLPVLFSKSLWLIFSFAQLTCPWEKLI